MGWAARSSQRTARCDSGTGSAATRSVSYIITKNARVVRASSGSRNVQYLMRPRMPDHSKAAQWYGYS